MIGLAHLSKKDLVFYGDRQNVKRLLEYYKARSCTELGDPRQLTTAIDICLGVSFPPVVVFPGSHL